MQSPGRPLVARREDRQRFWAAIARGLTTEDAGVAAGISPAVAARWFRHSGGMPSVSQAPLSGRYLSFVEREEVGLWRARGHGVPCNRETASPLPIHDLAGTASERRHPRRLPGLPSLDCPMACRSACSALFVQGRGALRRELSACLRTGRALRVPRARTRGRGKHFVSDAVMIRERPAEADDRAVPGHWEGDLIIGLDSSAIGTLVERTTRFTLLLHLSRMEDHGSPKAKNGPPLAGHGAEAVRDAIASTITTLPEQLRRSLTWDEGAELAQHAQLRIDTGLQVYFCDPHSPWQRGTNENTNGLLRQYFPKGTDLRRHSADDLAAVAATLNSRPRKTLGWRTPAETFDDFLKWTQINLRTVATIP
jgi:transposase, IS30 family